MSAPTNSRKTPSTSEARLQAAREWKQRNAAKQKEYRAARYAKIKSDPVLWQKKMESTRRSRVKTRAVAIAYEKNRDPLKKSAGCKIRQRVWLGQIKRQPCEVCGQANAEAHHDDYTKPLEVRWLCRTHHVEHHTKLRRALLTPKPTP